MQNSERQDMLKKTICVLGGSGFIGSVIVHHLDKAGFQVKVLTRRREYSKHLILLPNVTVLECDIMHDNALRQALKGCDAVINLVAILHQSRKHRFQTLHQQLVERLVTACNAVGIKRIIHISALNAEAGAASEYLKTKAAGEATLKKSTLDWTIFRPSVVFGAGDRFLNMFARLADITPVLPLACPDAKFQPIWVEDVARVTVASLNKPETIGQSYNLCGSKVYTLRQLVEFAATTTGVRTRIIGLSPSLGWLQARMMELLPVKLLTRDNLLSMKKDSVCDCAFPPIFGITPTALEAIAPEYLGQHTPRNRYNRFRSTAGR
jgi:NADH dehydrogenase